MRIKSLHIYQYGKFSNQTFHFSASPVQLIYGLNEAGKTTMMSFIESMLFGFPKTKNMNRKQAVSMAVFLKLNILSMGL